MRKLLLVLGLSLPAAAAVAQDKGDDKPSIFFRLGTGYSTRIDAMPGELDRDGKSHFRGIRQGININGQVGFFVNEKNAFALVYSRYGNTEATTIQGSRWNTNTATAFVGVTYQRFMPIGEKRDINFNVKIGPGYHFFREARTITAGTRVTQSDVSKQSLALITGAGVDFRISKTVRFDVSADRTWGTFSVGRTKTNISFVTVGAGFRFTF